MALVVNLVKMVLVIVVIVLILTLLEVIVIRNIAGDITDDRLGVANWQNCVMDIDAVIIRI